MSGRTRGVNAEGLRGRSRRFAVAVAALVAVGAGFVASQAGDAPGQPLAHPLFASLSASPSSVGPGGTVGMTLTIGASVSDPGVKVREIDIDYSGDAAFHSGSTSGAVTTNPDDNGSTWAWKGLDVHLINPSGPPTASMSFSFSAPTTPSSYGFSATVIADGAGDGGAQTSITVVGVSLPAVSIGDVSVGEGNSGATTASFPVTLSNATASTVTVSFATVDGSATAGSDYGSTSGTLTFAPGETSASIGVSVLGDTVQEQTETFSVDLSSPANATIADGEGVGTILDDDGTGPDLALTKQAGEVQIDVGDTVTYTIQATNVGTQTADGVALGDPLPAGMQLVQVSSSQGSCAGASCSLGVVEPGESVTVTLSARATSAGVKTNTATVSTIDADPNGGNNSASAVVRVAATEGGGSTPLPPPSAGEVNVEPVGTVGGQCIQTVDSLGCVPLTEGVQVPIGQIALIDPGTGAVSLQGIEGKSSFYGTPFDVTELNAPSSGQAAVRPVLVVRLLGGQFDRICRSSPKAKAAAGVRSTTVSLKSKKPVRRLWGKGTGRFRTQGRYSAGTVRGTWWVTIDRCDGTVTQVREGVVDVHDLVLRKHVMVRAGKSYLASPSKKLKKPKKPKPKQS